MSGPQGDPMSVLYLPGCTLKNKAANFDASFAAAMQALGVDMQELAGELPEPALVLLAVSRLAGADRLSAEDAAEAAGNYMKYCALCHGAERHLVRRLPQLLAVGMEAPQGLQPRPTRNRVGIRPTLRLARPGRSRASRKFTPISAPWVSCSMIRSFHDQE